MLFLAAAAWAASLAPGSAGHPTAARDAADLPPHFGYTTVTEAGGLPVLVTALSGPNSRDSGLTVDALREGDGLVKVGKPRVAASHFLALTAQKPVPFLVSADGSPIASRWLVHFDPNTYLLTLPRPSPPHRAAQASPKGTPPEFAWLTWQTRAAEPVLVGVRAGSKWDKEEIELRRGDRAEKQTLWRLSKAPVTVEVALNRVEWKTAGGKAVVQEALFNQAKETPVSVLVVTDGKELDPFWRQMLLPGACLAYIKQGEGGK